MSWSHSRLSLYQSCPLAYKLRYVDGEPQVASDAMRRGTHIHQAIEAYALACWRNGNRPLKSNFDAGRTIAMGYPEHEADIARFVENTEWEWGSTIVGEASPVEQMYQALLPGGELFRGKVDLLQRQVGAGADDPFGQSDDVWWLTDWKTGFSTYAADDLPLQLLAYAWLVQRKHPKALAFSLRIVCVGAPWSPPPWTVEGDLSWVGERLQAMVDRVRRDHEFEANVGAECLNCNMVHACPHAESATVKAIRSQRAEGHAADAVLIEARLKAEKAVIRKAVENGGPITVGDSVWGIWRSESTAPYSVREVVRICEAADVDPWPFIGMTASQFAKLRAKHPAIDDALWRCAKTTARTEFEVRKASRLPEPVPDPTGTHSHATDTAEHMPVAAGAGSE